MIKEELVSTDGRKVEQIIEFFKTVEHGKYLDSIDALNRNSVTIAYQDIINYQNGEDFSLYEFLLKKPTEFLSLTSQAVSSIFKERHGTSKIKSVYLDECDNKISVVEALGNKHINKLITITGLVTSSTGLYNLPETRVFVCIDGHTINSKTEIKKCLRCKQSIEEITPEENFRQHRILYLQSEEFGYHGDELRIDLEGDLCNLADSGDRVKITGIIETERSQKATFHNVVRVINISKPDDLDLTLTESIKEEFKKFVEEPDFYSRLINSIAPSIFGLIHVKESILLQIVGGTNRIKNDGSMIRGWINIGLFGDYGTAKTKIGEWVEQNIPRSKFVGSKGATATGLIMGLEDGPDGRKVLRTGAMVNCRDGGVVILDEFPRLNPEVIDALYTTSENGIASSAKTGNQSRVKADASLLLTGNAHNGEWSEALSVQDNLAIDPTFLSRIDFMWIFKDDFTNDERLAGIMLNDSKYDDDVKPVSTQTLVKYIKFCRSTFHPELTEEVNKLLTQTWMELRKDPKAKDNGINPRHLETLARTTLAITRIYQRNHATIEDAAKAIKLIKEMFKQRNISIAYADTYIQRNLNKALEILRNENTEGLVVSDLKDKVMLYGSEENQKQAMEDLGPIRELQVNKKWRSVVEELKRSHLIHIRNRKPLILAYKHELGVLDHY